MPQKVRAQMPDGSIRTFNSQAEAEAEARRMGFIAISVPAQAPAAPPSAPAALAQQNNWLQNLMEDLAASGSATAKLGMGQMFGGPMAADIAGGLVNKLAHPVQNAPELGALGASALATVVAPEITLPAMALRLGAAGLGGFGGGLVRGDTPEQAAWQGVEQGAMQGLLGEVPIGLAAKIGRPLANRMGYNALKITPEDLAKTINPKTGRVFTDLGDAERYLKKEVVMDPNRSLERPSSSAYHKDIATINQADRAEKEAIMNTSTAGFQPADTFMTPGSFDPLFEQARVTADTRGARENILDTLGTYFRDKNFPTQTTYVPGMPAHGPQTPWTPPRTGQPAQLSGFNPITPAGPSTARPTPGVPGSPGMRPGTTTRLLPAIGETDQRIFSQGRAGVAGNDVPHNYDFGDPVKLKAETSGGILPEELGEVTNIGSQIAAEHGRGLGGLWVERPSNWQATSPGAFPHTGPSVNPMQPEGLRPAPQQFAGGRGSELLGHQPMDRFPMEPVASHPSPTQGTPTFSRPSPTGQFEFTPGGSAGPGGASSMRGPGFGQMPATSPSIPMHPQTTLRDLNARELDEYIRGLDDVLAKAYDAQKVRQVFGSDQGPQFGTETLQQVRANAANKLKQAHPRIAELNASMSTNIPLEEIANRATPSHSASINPKLAVVGSSSNPRWRIFQNIRPPEGFLARPLQRIADTAEKIGPSTPPQLARIIQLLLQGNQENR